jgi:hypothetical protein
MRSACGNRSTRPRVGVLAHGTESWICTEDGDMIMRSSTWLPGLVEAVAVALYWRSSGEGVRVAVMVMSWPG